MTDPDQHTLVEVVNPNAGSVLCTDGTSQNLSRSSRIVSDRIVFVDNVADSMTKEEFVDLVKEYATRGAIVDIRFLRRTKGGSFAFIEFENEEDGRAAIAALNTKDFTTNSGKVLELRASKAENPEETVSNKNLYVKGIPRPWTNEDLKKRFRYYGSISHCRVLKQPGNEEENTGVGFVHFFNALDAAKAIEGVDEHYVDENEPGLGTLEVKFARAKKSRQRRQRRRNRRQDLEGVANDFQRAQYGGNYGGGRGRAMRNHNGRGMRNNRGGWGGMNGGFGGEYGQNMYPPNEEMWAKMVEIMQSMSMWQNPYNMGYQYGNNNSEQ